MGIMVRFFLYHTIGWMLFSFCLWPDWFEILTFFFSLGDESANVFYPLYSILQLVLIRLYGTLESKTLSKQREFDLSCDNY